MTPLLTLEQASLLEQLVEAALNVDRLDRQPFQWATWDDASTRVVHRGFSSLGQGWGEVRVALEDIEVLFARGLIVSSGRRDSFHISPEGYAYYDRRRRGQGSPILRQQQRVKSLIEGEGFRSRHPEAYRRWARAEEMLWSDSSDETYSQIGHLCREAVQHFAIESLGGDRSVADHPIEKSKSNVAAVLKPVAESVGGTRADGLEKLLYYWGAVVDLIQRQEHAGQKEGEPITWDDSRATVLLTMVAMSEIDRALSATR